MKENVEQQISEEQLVYRVGKIQHDRFWIERPDGRMFQVDHHAKKVLEQLANHQPNSFVSEKLNVDEEDISLLFEMLGIQQGAHFLLVDETKEISPDYSSKTAFIHPLLERRSFQWMIFIGIAVSVGLVTLFMMNTPAFFAFTLKDQWILVGALTLSVIIHEIGHWLTMPRNQNISMTVHWSGPVPLLSIICNEAWKLSKWQRMRINLAGFVADMMIAGLAASLGLLFGQLSPWIWTFLFIHLLRMLFAIWPLLPGDGYWILVDLFNQPNLWANATEQLKQLKWNWLSLYAIARILFLAFIWLLYGYVIYLWIAIVATNPSGEALKFLLYPAPLLLFLNLLNQLYMGISFITQRFARSTVAP